MFPILNLMTSGVKLNGLNSTEFSTKESKRDIRESSMFQF